MKIRIIAGGIYGKDGEIPIGTELDVKDEPTGWAGRYEVVGKDAPAEAAPVINPETARVEDRPRRGRPPRSEG